MTRSSRHRQKVIAYLEATLENLEQCKLPGEVSACSFKKLEEVEKDIRRIINKYKK